jgi:hypothetical protein
VLDLLDALGDRQRGVESDDVVEASGTAFNPADSAASATAVALGGRCRSGTRLPFRRALLIVQGARSIRWRP